METNYGIWGDLWYNDKCIVSTFPKVASRMTQAYFGKAFRYNYSPTTNKLKNNLEIVIKDKSSIDYNFEEGVQVIEEAFNKTSDRDIILLYRNPYKRTVSGLYQEFISSFDTYDASHEYFLKKKDYSKIIEDNFDNPKEIYDFINIQSVDWDWGTIPSFHVFKPLEIKLLKLLLDDFLKTFVEDKEKVVNLNHTRLYLSNLYQIFKEDILDVSKVKLLDIGEIDVEQVFKKYQSNPKVLDKYRNIKRTIKSTEYKNPWRNVELNELVEAKLKEPKYQSILSDVLSEETDIYNYLKTLPNNIKKDII